MGDRVLTWRWLLSPSLQLRVTQRHLIPSRIIQETCPAPLHWLSLGPRVPKTVSDRKTSCQAISDSNKLSDCRWNSGRVLAYCAVLGSSLESWNNSNNNTVLTINSIKQLSKFSSAFALVSDWMFLYNHPSPHYFWISNPFLFFEVQFRYYVICSNFSHSTCVPMIRVPH